MVGAAENNLKNSNVDFPLGVMTCVTGVSGSGKSSLVNEILDVYKRQELVSKLNIPNNDIAYYDAETDKELEQYKMLIEDEKLSHRVTISTKVLDVGINIKSEKVNVVTFEDDPIEIKQMVGRKRAKSGETVLVYFFVPTISELKQRQGQICNERNNRCV